MPPARNVVVGQRVQEAKVVRAKELRREMTPAERLLWARLRRNQLGGLHFRRQQIIDGFIADFYCHAAGIVVELDGTVHDQQAGYDAERDRIFEARGLCVLRFGNGRVVAGIEAVLHEIASACAERIGAARQRTRNTTDSPPRHGEGPGEGSAIRPNPPTPFPPREGGEPASLPSSPPRGRRGSEGEPAGGSPSPAAEGPGEGLSS